MWIKLGALVTQKQYTRVHVAKIGTCGSSSEVLITRYTLQAVLPRGALHVQGFRLSALKQMQLHSGSCEMFTVAASQETLTTQQQLGLTLTCAP